MNQKLMRHNEVHAYTTFLKSNSCREISFLRKKTEYKIRYNIKTRKSDDSD